MGEPPVADGVQVTTSCPSPGFTRTFVGALGTVGRGITGTEALGWLSPMRLRAFTLTTTRWPFARPVIWQDSAPVVVHVLPEGIAVAR
jgi:hypothetical protein